MLVAWSATRSRKRETRIRCSARAIVFGSPIMKVSSSRKTCSLSASTSLSRAQTSRASASSRSTSARMTRRIWSSTSAPIASRVCLSASSSSWKWRCIESASYRAMSPLTAERSCLRQLGRSSARTTLPESPGDVILGSLVHGLGEELRGGPELHQLTEQEESRRVGHARRLLHVVRDDDDGQVALELEDQLLDTGGRDRIERGARLVHQEDFRLDRQRASDAEALLLAARQSRPRLGQAVFDLVPQGG